MFILKESEGDSTAYDFVELPDGSRRRLTDEERSSEQFPGRRLQFTILTSPRIREGRTGYYPILFKGQEYLPTAGEWKTNREGVRRLIVAARIDRTGSTLRYVRYLEDFPATTLTNTWTNLVVPRIQSTSFKQAPKSSSAAC